MRWQAEAARGGESDPERDRERGGREFQGRRGEFRRERRPEGGEGGRRPGRGYERVERPQRQERGERSERGEWKGGRRAEREARGPMRQDERGRGRFERDGERGRGPRGRVDEGRGGWREPLLRGWNVSLYPESAGVEGIAREIKQTLKAFPLFGLARLVLEKPSRWRVRLRNVKGPALWRVVADGSLWLSREQALDYACKQMLPKYFRVETLPAEAPKGNFSCVAQLRAERGADFAAELS